MLLRRCAVLAVLAIAVTAAPGAAAGPPEIAGVTTLTSSTTGYTRVTIRKETRLRSGPTSRNGGIRLTGGGRFVAFALVQERKNGFFIVGGHTQYTAPVVAAAGEIVGSLGSTKLVEGQYIVPAGTYRLYLVPDGKPAQISLTFGGLRGRRDLRSVVRRSFAVQGDLRADPSKTQGLLSFGDNWTGPASGQSLWFMIVAMRFEAHAETDAWICQFEGHPEGPNPYLPGCPSLNDAHSNTVLLSYGEVWLEPRYLLLTGLALFPSGPVAGGCAAFTGAVITEADGKQLWLQL